MECFHVLNNGFILRIILTFITLYVLYLYINNKIIIKYIYLIFPLILLLLDFSDNYFLKKGNESILKHCLTHYDCHHLCEDTFYYHSRDKIVDSLSYVLSYIFLLFFIKDDYLLLFFVLYRMVGAILFYFTKNSSWFILFFDFIKEYLLYLFIFGKNFKYLPICIALKIMFESIFHTVCFPNNY